MRWVQLWGSWIIFDIAFLWDWNSHQFKLKDPYLSLETRKLCIVHMFPHFLLLSCFLSFFQLILNLIHICINRREYDYCLKNFSSKYFYLSIKSLSLNSNPQCLLFLCIIHSNLLTFLISRIDLWVMKVQSTKSIWWFLITALCSSVIFPPPTRTCVLQFIISKFLPLCVIKNKNKIINIIVGYWVLAVCFFGSIVLDSTFQPVSPPA